MPFTQGTFPPGAIIKVKLKIGEEWYDTAGTRVVSGLTWGFNALSWCHVKRDGDYFV